MSFHSEVSGYVVWLSTLAGFTSGVFGSYLVNIYARDWQIKRDEIRRAFHDCFSSIDEFGVKAEKYFQSESPSPNTVEAREMLMCLTDVSSNISTIENYFGIISASVWDAYRELFISASGDEYSTGTAAPSFLVELRMKTHQCKQEIRNQFYADLRKGLGRRLFDTFFPQTLQSK